jgi:hypothetical protein
MANPRCACAVCRADRVVLGFVGFLMLLLVFVGFLGCATVPTPRGIARELDRCLFFRPAAPLSWRCECVTSAERACAAAGLDGRCFADGWVDADRDAWTIAACRERRAER